MKYQALFTWSVFLFFLAVPVGEVQAASVYKKSLDKKIGAYLQDGVIVGGRVGKGYTLLSLRRSFTKQTETERVVLDIGDINGKPILGEVGYYHVSIERSPARVVIDLAQVSRSGVDQDKLLKIFKSSPLVKSAEITYDPEDSATNLVLNFKYKTQVEVFEINSPNAPGRIVIDMKPKRTASAGSRS